VPAPTVPCFACTAPSPSAPCYFTTWHPGPHCDVWRLRPWRYGSRVNCPQPPPLVPSSYLSSLPRRRLSLVCAPATAHPPLCATAATRPSLCSAAAPPSISSLRRPSIFLRRVCHPIRRLTRSARHGGWVRPPSPASLSSPLEPVTSLAASLSSTLNRPRVVLPSVRYCPSLPFFLFLDEFVLTLAPY
jgi:hypothetical protein